MSFPSLRTRLKLDFFQVAVGLLAVATCVALPGCVMVPVRAPTHIVGPAGKVKTLDVKFLTPTVTNREEVRQKLAEVSAVADFEHFYWARWGQSKWAVAWAVGGGYQGAGGVDRLWGSENLIVRFDDSGTVSESRRVSDKELAPELRKALRSESKLAPEWPIKLQMDHRHHGTQYQVADISLSPDRIEVSEPFNPKHRFGFAPADVIGLKTPTGDAGEGNRLSIQQTVLLKSKTPAGTKLVLRMEANDLIWLLRYVNEYCPNVR